MSTGDKRRELGADTRGRLIEAMAEALARSGPQAVSMRAVAVAAGANVAAVKYHFGSREQLIDAVLADATQRVSSEQERRLALVESDPEATVRDWIEAWGGPIVAVALSDAPAERRLGRIISNAINERSGLGTSLHERTSAADRRLVRGLAAVLAPVEERELWLRLTVMVSALVGLAGGSFAGHLERAATGEALDERLFELLEAVVRSSPRPG